MRTQKREAKLQTRWRRAWEKDANAETHHMGWMRLYDIQVGAYTYPMGFGKLLYNEILYMALKVLEWFCMAFWW